MSLGGGKPSFRLDRLELPLAIVKRSLGDLRLRGKGADLALYALTKSERARRIEVPASREVGRVQQTL